VVEILDNINPAQLDPGYIFMAPYYDGIVYQGGPQIFQNDGVRAIDVKSVHID
jgi:hypothetical protein